MRFWAWNMSCIFDNFNFLNIGLVCAFLLQVNIRKGLFCNLSIPLNHIPKLSYWITCGTRSVNYISSSVHCRVIHISICTLELDISSNQMRLQGNVQPAYIDAIIHNAFAGRTLVLSVAQRGACTRIRLSMMSKRMRNPASGPAWIDQNEIWILNPHPETTRL